MDSSSEDMPSSLFPPPIKPPSLPQMTLSQTDSELDNKSLKSTQATVDPSIITVAQEDEDGERRRERASLMYVQLTRKQKLLLNLLTVSNTTAAWTSTSSHWLATLKWRREKGDVKTANRQLTTAHSK